MKLKKKILYYLLYPFVFLWIALAWIVFQVGTLLRNLGNRMTGYRLDDSIGTLHVEFE